MVQILDAASTPPVGVTTPSRFGVFVGYAPRELLFFGGIANCNWTSHGDLDREDFIVNLGVGTTASFQYTCTTSLSSISSEDGDFVFATDSAVVEKGPAPDELLQLKVRVAAQGSSATLHGFSYSVQVLSDPVRSRLAGLISWNRGLGDPASAVLNGSQPMFRVAVGETVTGSPSGPGQFGSSSFVEATAGFSGVPALAGDTWTAPYQVDGVGFGRVLEVWPALLPGMLAGPPSGYSPSPSFTPAQKVTLTPSLPSAIGVDFTMTFTTPPK